MPAVQEALAQSLQSPQFGASLLSQMAAGHPNQSPEGGMAACAPAQQTGRLGLAHRGRLQARRA